jgi:integrase
MASFEERKGGWYARCFKGRTPEGKVRFASKLFRTLKEAQAWARDTETRVAQNSYIPPSNVTTGEWLGLWLGGTAADRVKEQTLASYSKMIDRYLRPSLGAVPLDKLAYADVKGCYASLTRRGLSARTVKYAHAILRQALDEAQRENRIYKNPCDLARLPKSVKQDRAVLDTEQAARFLVAAAQDEWYAYWHLQLATGMRPSEGLALKWSDIDDNVLNVQRTVVPTVEGQGWRFDTPKTGGSRVVPLDRVTLFILKGEKKAQAERRLKLGTRWHAHGLIFTRDGRPLDLHSLRRNHFKRIVKRAKLDPKLTPYSLRHSNISALLSAGEALLTVSARVGHASAKMTLDVYGHSFTADQRSTTVLDKLMALWKVS